MKKISILIVFLSSAVLTICPKNIWAQSHPEAGFCTLEENICYFHTGSYFNRLALQTSQTRIWRVFQPADEDPSSKPLFVFYNGGPGGATTAGLFSAYTGRNAVSVDAKTGIGTMINNPHSWTCIGNLLHIDSRTAGFSYSLMDNPQDNNQRQAEWDAQNYNAFVDAADFVRVLLRFLGDHPQIQRNPVLLAVESYGGIRALVMLHLLLYYQDYGNGKAIYQDPALAEEIQAHYNTIFPEYAGQRVPPSVISRQFSHQVLIQPAITRYFQRTVAVDMLEAPGSILDQLSQETGVPYIRYEDQPWAAANPSPYNIMNNIYDYLDTIGRDPYFYSKPDGFFSGYFDAAAELLIHYDDLCQMTGVDVAEIPELYASARQRAYKIRNLEDDASQISLSALIGPVPKASDLHSFLFPYGEDDMEAVFGTLEPWDRYYIDLNYDVSLAFSLSMLVMQGYDTDFRYSELFGDMFLEITAFVETFITNAAFDIVVYSPALPEALAFHSSKLNHVTHDAAGPSEKERPGQIILNYIPGSVPDSNVTERIIRFPRYSNSGHAVTMTEPGEILDDVISWLNETSSFRNARMSHIRGRKLGAKK
jgi:pimeloyl-ACP methyl ester carboxylesterase